MASYEEFAHAFHTVAESFGCVLVEELAVDEEHRFAVVDGVVRAVTNRVPPRVVGDGTTDVSGLIEARNRERAARGNPLHRQPLDIDEAVRSTLKSQDVSLDTVPDSGQTVWLRRTSNISLGGDAIDQTDAVSPEHTALVERASAAIPGLHVGGFDVLLPSNGAAPATVLEVNPNPMFSMHYYPWEGTPRDVYRYVLDAMFPETVADDGIGA